MIKDKTDVHFRFNADDYQKIKAAAAGCNCTIQDFITEAAKWYTDKDITDTSLINAQIESVRQTCSDLSDKVQIQTYFFIFFVQYFFYTHPLPDAGFSHKDPAWKEAESLMHQWLADCQRDIRSSNPDVWSRLSQILRCYDSDDKENRNVQ